MPSSSVPVYEDTRVFQMGGYTLPTIISGQVIIVEASYSNPDLKMMAGAIVPFKFIPGIGDVQQRWNRVYLGTPKFITINLPYFPQDYQVKFFSTWFFWSRPLTLKIWEVIE